MCRWFWHWPDSACCFPDVYFHPYVGWYPSLPASRFQNLSDTLHIWHVHHPPLWQAICIFLATLTYTFSARLYVFSDAFLGALSPTESAIVTCTAAELGSNFREIQTAITPGTHTQVSAWGWAQDSAAQHHSRPTSSIHDNYCSIVQIVAYSGVESVSIYRPTVQCSLWLALYCTCWALPLQQVVNDWDSDCLLSVITRDWGTSSATNWHRNW